MHPVKRALSHMVVVACPILPVARLRGQQSAHQHPLAEQAGGDPITAAASSSARRTTRTGRH